MSVNHFALWKLSSWNLSCKKHAENGFDGPRSRVLAARVAFKSWLLDVWPSSSNCVILFNGFSMFFAFHDASEGQSHPKPHQSWRRAASFGRCRTADVSIASASFALNRSIFFKCLPRYSCWNIYLQYWVILVVTVGKYSLYPYAPCIQAALVPCLVQKLPEIHQSALSADDEPPDSS